MKKALLTLLAVFLVVAALGGAGYAGYRIGYRQGAPAGGNSTPSLRGFEWGPQNMPMHNFGRGFERGAEGFGMRRGMGFGFFSPLMFLGRIVFWGLLILLIVWLVTRSGLQVSFKRQAAENPRAETPEPEAKVE